jgi:hypothetical protein
MARRMRITREAFRRRLKGMVWCWIWGCSSANKWWERMRNTHNYRDYIHLYPIIIGIIIGVIIGIILYIYDYIPTSGTIVITIVIASKKPQLHPATVTTVGSASIFELGDVNPAGLRLDDWFKILLEHQ